MCEGILTRFLQVISTACRELGDVVFESSERPGEGAAPCARACRRRTGFAGALGRAWACGNILVVSVLGVAYLLASLRPLAEIAPPLAGLMPPFAHELHRVARRWHLVSGYGLFRRMTGVHPEHKKVFANSGGESVSVCG